MLCYALPSLQTDTSCFGCPRVRRLESLVFDEGTTTCRSVRTS